MVLLAILVSRLRRQSERRKTKKAFASEASSHTSPSSYSDAAERELELHQTTLVVSSNEPIMASVVYLKMNFNFRPMFGGRASAECDLMDDDGRMVR